MTDPDPHAGERRSIQRAAQGPVTRRRLLEDLRSLGVREGEVLLVHASLSKIGWVAGKAQAAVMALAEALGESGTLVMPAFSMHLTDPAEWKAPPVPESWWPTLREETPAFVRDLTPTRMMGAIAECFRSWHGTVRSEHPHASFCARGPRAREITDGHVLESKLGEGSPLARLYELDARVLLLGVTHANNSSLHLAEHRADWPGKRLVPDGAPLVDERGERRWVRFESPATEDQDFARLGEEFERETGSASVGRVGHAEARLFSQRAAVDYAVVWLPRNRGRGESG